MGFELWQLLGLLLLGVGVGFVSSLFGVGGGVIIVPFLPLLIDIEPVQVVWISLTCITFIVLVNVVAYAGKGFVEWHIIFRLAPFALMGAYVSAAVSTQVSPVLLRLITAFLLLYLAQKMFSKKSLAVSGPFYERFIFLMSFFGGAASALTGIGTGALLSPLLLKMGKIRPQSVAPTVNGILFCSAGTSLISYFINRGEELRAMSSSFWLAAFCISVASLTSSFWGRRIQLGLSEARRKRLLGGMLVVFSIIVFLQVLRGAH